MHLPISFQIANNAKTSTDHKNSRENSVRHNLDCFIPFTYTDTSSVLSIKLVFQYRKHNEKKNIKKMGPYFNQTKLRLALNIAIHLGGLTD